MNRMNRPDPFRTADALALGLSYLASLGTGPRGGFVRGGCRGPYDRAKALKVARARARRKAANRMRARQRSR